MQVSQPGQPARKILYRVSEVALILGLSRHSVYRMVREGNIEHRLVGGRYIRIPRDAVMRELGLSED